MRTHRYVAAGMALVASTILISCGSDNNDAPAGSVVTSVSGSSVENTLPIAETTVDNSTGSSVENSVETTSP